MHLCLLKILFSQSVFCHQSIPFLPKSLLASLDVIFYSLLLLLVKLIQKLISQLKHYCNCFLAKSAIVSKIYVTVMSPEKVILTDNNRQTRPLTKKTPYLAYKENALNQWTEENHNFRLGNSCCIVYNSKYIYIARKCNRF